VFSHKPGGSQVQDESLGHLWVEAPVIMLKVLHLPDAGLLSSIAASLVGAIMQLPDTVAHSPYRLC